MSNTKQEKNDYQKTLNLPKTDFSMRAGLAQKEPQYLEQWEKSDIYGKLKKKSEGKDSFILHDGPPYANGNIHIGHALNKILKDFIVKSKAMQGLDSHYLPGWDCHGLPIEHQLLKELKKRKSDVDCVEFRKSAHDYAMKYVGIQRDQFKRLGIMGEWDDPYLTLDPNYEYWILKSLAELNKKGYVYRGLKPVNWCFRCETALAEAEVEYEDHTSKSVYVKFEVTNKEQIDGLPDKPLHLLIWTTTPWTLIANVAVSVHPGFKYKLVDVGGEVLIVESSLADSVLNKAGITDATVVKEVSGDELTSLLYKQPFGTIEAGRVIVADFVTKEDGTGLVHTAPGHGQDDFIAGKANDLETVMPVDDRGRYTKEAGKYEGENVFKANDQIIEELKGNGSLLIADDLQHSYPHCWRCKNPIIFRATKQWFLKIDHDNLRAKLSESIQKDVQWIPDVGEERIAAMVATRPDWCLSRQRYWGVPIPALKNKETGEHELFPEVIEHFAEIVKDEGTNAWFERDVKDLVPDGVNADDFEKTFDILDVWFDSGVSCQAAVKAKMERDLPADMYLEGSDQHRGWFQSSLIPAIAMEGRPPFKSVLTHGFVVDGQGRKMSKSLGNVMSPHDIIKVNGADILRLWVAASSYNEDIRVSKEILDRLIDAYRKIRNTIRYLLGNLHDFDPSAHEVSYDELLDLDKWALCKLSGCVSNVKEFYNKYQFANAYKSIYTFCNEELSSFYLDILKDRLYTSATNSPERRAAQTVLYHILNHLVRLLAPMLCFTAEEIFLAMPKTKEMEAVDSVHLLEWLEEGDQWRNSEVEEQFRTLTELRPHVLKALEDKRRDGLIGSSLEAKIIFETESPRDYEYLTQMQDRLPAAFIVSDVDVKKQDGIKEGLSQEFAKTSITIEKASGQKCGRCWNYKSDVGEDQEHQTLCARCTQIVKEFTHGTKEDG